MAKRVTMQTVAEMAGVSRGTVDRVIKKRPHVSPDVHERVVRALKQSGYLSQQEAKGSASSVAFRPLKLGVLMPVWVGQLRQEFKRGIEDARKLLGSFNTEVIVRQCANDEPGEALHQIELLVDEGIDGLAVCVINGRSISYELKRLSEKGLPVITYNSDLPDSGRLAFIGQDPFKSGRIAGEIMSKLVGNRQLLACCGNREFFAHDARIKGFREVMERRGFDTSRITVLETFNDYAITLRKISGFLDTVKNPGKNLAIYMANRSVTGCIEAMKGAGITEHIPLVCHDYSAPVQEFLQQGTVDFTIAQDLRMQGYLPLVLLRNHLHNVTASLYHESQIIHVLCAENIEAFLNN